MPDVALPFGRDEYAARLNKVRLAMDAAGIEVLVVTDPSNMAWLTGYDGWSFYVHQAVIVTHDDVPRWWGRLMDGFGAHRTAYIPESHIHTYSDDYVQSTERHAMDHLSMVFDELGLKSRRIGVEMENYYFTAAAYECLKRNLPNAEFIDATSLVNWQRTIKSPTEIEYMRRAAQIVEKMHARVLDKVEPGIRKNDLVAEIYDQGIRGTEEFGGDYPAIVPLTPTGLDATAAHLTWNDKPMESGAGTFFELAGCYRRYHAPLCRTIYLGDPPRDMIEAERAVVEGLEEGLDVARAGNRACDVAMAFHGALKRAGIHREGRCGYPVGLSYPPDWGERTISFRESDQSVLKPGMTFHFMPGLWAKTWGLEITETILIRDDGAAECLAHYPRKLFIKR
ncbi:MAG: ectoine hydrolase DoeA [marine bacterium B5-7]|nr:MAG: ectoine hydrolase DoeA [marine bacterium B5-7]